MVIISQTEDHIIFKCDKCSNNIRRPVNESLLCPFCKTEENHPSSSMIVTNVNQLKRRNRKSKPCTSSGIEKTKRWIRAVARWMEAGSPIRSDEEVKRIYDLCQMCKFYSKHGSCKLCGCKLSRSKIAFLNKIRMATEDCPKNYWTVQ